MDKIYWVAAAVVVIVAKKFCLRETLQDLFMASLKFDQANTFLLPLSFEKYLVTEFTFNDDDDGSNFWFPQRILSFCLFIQQLWNVSTNVELKKMLFQSICAWANLVTVKAVLSSLARAMVVVSVSAATSEAVI